MFINDLEDGVQSTVLKFADDTKLYTEGTKEEGGEQLQEDLGRFRWLPRVSRATAENSVVSQVDRPGSTMVVPVGQMGILSAHTWCCISDKNMMEETNDLCKSRMQFYDSIIAHFML